MADDRLGLLGREPRPGQRGPRLEARDLSADDRDDLSVDDELTLGLLAECAQGVGDLGLRPLQIARVERVLRQGEPRLARGQMIFAQFLAEDLQRLCQRGLGRVELAIVGEQEPAIVQRHRERLRRRSGV